MNVHPTGFWTFICNPAFWEIDKFLREGIIYDNYTITDWQKDWFKPNQPGVIRVGVDKRSNAHLRGNRKLEPGIYAIVEVIGEVRQRGYEEDPYWLIPIPGGPDRLVVDIQYTVNLLNSPVLLKDLKDDPNVTDKYLLNGFQGSSIPLNPDTFDYIVSLADIEELVYQRVGYSTVRTMYEIKALEMKYLGASPQVKEFISQRIEKGRIALQVKEAAGFGCMICQAMGQMPYPFLTKYGQPYLEVHHEIPSTSFEMDSLTLPTLLCVCPNHHRQLHYGDVEVYRNDDQVFSFWSDGEIVNIKKLQLEN